MTNPPTHALVRRADPKTERRGRREIRGENTQMTGSDWATLAYQWYMVIPHYSRWPRVTLPNRIGWSIQKLVLPQSPADKSWSWCAMLVLSSRCLARQKRLLGLRWLSEEIIPRSRSTFFNLFPPEIYFNVSFSPSSSYHSCCRSWLIEASIGGIELPCF